MLADCSSGTIAFILSRPCLGEPVLELLSRLCSVELVEGPWECVLSGVKVSRGLAYPAPEGCAYLEVSQGYYIGLLPGYVDAQCLYCGGELRCRYGLQRRACYGSGPAKVAVHLDVESIGRLARSLSEVSGDFVWCVTRDGEVKYVPLGRSPM